tara:strand:+ start:272 stop:466 length:195 start_codon:yes stop_codon:yes gene_type:complete
MLVAVAVVLKRLQEAVVKVEQVEVVMEDTHLDQAELLLQMELQTLEVVAVVVIVRVQAMVEQEL